MNPRRSDNDQRMLVRDRQRLAALMALSGVSVRGLASAAGWSSPSYAHRLLRGDVRSVGAGSAVRIASRLDVAVDELFVPVVTTISGRRVRDAEQVA